MPALGRFLELSLPAPDIRASLEFYLGLGFTELRVNDIRPYHYAVVTDGHVVLGLHGAGLEEPALAFVRPGVAAHAHRLAELGIELAFQRLAEDEFNEAGLYAPDGLLILLMEARTFSAGSLADVTAPSVGRAREISLRSADPRAALPFWLEAGFAPVEEDASDEGALELAGAGITVGLRPGLAWRGPLLRYGDGDPMALAALDLKPVSHRGGFSLVAPEGTRLVWDQASRGR